MASDYFLQIEGIKGESKDAKHKQQIDVLSWSWGASQLGSAGGGNALDGEDLTFRHHIDKASPILMLSCATGKHIPKAELFVRKATTNEGDYYKITLSDCLISSFHQGAEGGDLPTEEVTMNYSQVEVTYSPVRNDALGTPISSGVIQDRDN